MNEGWVRIENLSQYILGDIPIYSPRDPRHTPFWRDLKKKCIEGVWGVESNGYRFMPPKLFYYGNFYTIEITDNNTKTRNKLRPLIRDLEWERAYMLLEAQGFSGFLEDEYYTSDKDIFLLDKNKLPSSSLFNFLFFTPEGKFKEYIPPRENIRRLHEKPKNAPLYRNGTSNIIELGSRGGGKSYFWGATGQHELNFDSAKYYRNEIADKLGLSKKDTGITTICVGSGRTDKSSEFVNKIVVANEMLKQDPRLGVFGSEEDPDRFEPCPFYKEMEGTWRPNNKANPWRNKYKVKIGNNWFPRGTGSTLYHVNYSTQKTDGAQAAAGGRYNMLFYEEIGLTELLIDAYASNMATTSGGDSKRFGVQIFLGTSGNMDTVLPSKEIFTNPEQYNCLTFPDIWEDSGNIGFFLPAYMTISDYKDEDGNTDLERAKEHFKQEEEKAASASNPTVLRTHFMNYPVKPSHMWINAGGKVLPSEEATIRIDYLMKEQRYKKLGTIVDLYWDSSKPNGVDYNIDHGNLKQPFYEFRNMKIRDSLEGAIVIYEMPQYIHGEIPDDMYLFTHDPYVSDDMGEGGSIASTHVYINPKYESEGYTVNVPVATYHGKHPNGKKGYYSNLEKLLSFYGNPIRGLYYEANRGQFCEDYFKSKGKEFLLCLRPQSSDDVHDKVIRKYGIMIGNHHAKLQMLDDLSDMLLSEIQINGESKKVIEGYNCIFTLRQIEAHDLNNPNLNLDALSSILLHPVAVREILKEMQQSILRKKKNRLSFLSQNKSMFHV